MYLHMLVIEVYNLLFFSYDDMNCQYITVGKYFKWNQNYAHWVRKINLCSQKIMIEKNIKLYFATDFLMKRPQT